MRKRRRVENNKKRVFGADAMSFVGFFLQDVFAIDKDC